MLFDFDYLFEKIVSDIFCEASIALQLKKLHDLTSRQILKTNSKSRNTTRIISSNHKGRAPRGLSFSHKSHAL